MTPLPLGLVFAKAAVWPPPGLAHGLSSLPQPTGPLGSPIQAPVAPPTPPIVMGTKAEEANQVIAPPTEPLGAGFAGNGNPFLRDLANGKTPISVGGKSEPGFEEAEDPTSDHHYVPNQFSWLQPPPPIKPFTLGGTIDKMLPRTPELAPKPGLYNSPHGQYLPSPIEAAMQSKGPPQFGSAFHHPPAPYDPLSEGGKSEPGFLARHLTGNLGDTPVGKDIIAAGGDAWDWGQRSPSWMPSLGNVPPSPYEHYQHYDYVKDPDKLVGREPKAAPPPTNLELATLAAPLAGKGLGFLGRVGQYLTKSGPVTGSGRVGGITVSGGGAFPKPILPSTFGEAGAAEARTAMGAKPAVVPPVEPVPVLTPPPVRPSSAIPEPVPLGPGPAVPPVAGGAGGRIVGAPSPLDVALGARPAVSAAEAAAPSGGSLLGRAGREAALFGGRAVTGVGPIIHGARLPYDAGRFLASGVSGGFRSPNAAYWGKAFAGDMAKLTAYGLVSPAVMAGAYHAYNPHETETMHAERLQDPNVRELDATGQLPGENVRKTVLSTPTLPLRALGGTLQKAWSGETSLPTLEGVAGQLYAHNARLGGMAIDNPGLAFRRSGEVISNETSRLLNDAGARGDNRAAVYDALKRDYVSFVQDPTTINLSPADMTAKLKEFQDRASSIDLPSPHSPPASTGAHFLAKEQMRRMREQIGSDNTLNPTQRQAKLDALGRMESSLPTPAELATDEIRKQLTNPTAGGWDVVNRLPFSTKADEENFRRAHGQASEHFGFAEMGRAALLERTLNDNHYPKIYGKRLDDEYANSLAQAGPQGPLGPGVQPGQVPASSDAVVPPVGQPQGLMAGVGAQSQPSTHPDIDDVASITGTLGGVAGSGILPTLGRLQTTDVPGQPTTYQRLAAGVAGSAGAGAAGTLAGLGSPGSSLLDAKAAPAPGATLMGTGSGQSAITNPAADPVTVKATHEAMNKMVAQYGGDVGKAVASGALASLAASAPPPRGFESYWKTLPQTSKILAIAGVSLAGIALLHSLFGGDDDDDEDEKHGKHGGGGFLSKALPFIGIGGAAMAAYGAGGGTFSELPKMQTYEHLWDATKNNFGDLKDRVLGAVK